jgi:hypothetical protein
MSDGAAGNENVDEKTDGKDKAGMKAHEPISTPQSAGLFHRIAVIFGLVAPIVAPVVHPPENQKAEYEALLNHLTRSIANERLRAVRLILVAMVGSLAAVVWLWHLSDGGLKVITDSSTNESRYTVTAYLLIKGVTYSGLIGGLLFGVFRLARAAMDQATRFDKRLIALHFIRFATGADRIDGKMLPLVVQVLTAWSATVDSAYTQHESHKNKPVSSLRVKVGDHEVEIKDEGDKAA